MKFLHPLFQPSENNVNLRNTFFILAITGATISPAFLNLRLHHITLFFAFLAIATIEKNFLGHCLSKLEYFLLLSFIFIPLASGINSKYLFTGIDAYKQQILFIWTAITWVFFFKNSNHWNWRKILYTIILGDIFVVLYVVQAIVRKDFYIATTESSYSYMIAIIAMLYYRFSPDNKNIKIPILIFNLSLSLLILLFFSTSRGGSLGLLCGILAFSIVIFFLTLFIVLIAPLYLPHTTPYLGRVIRGVAEINEEHGTAADRYILWGKILKDSLIHPLGTGAGSYRTLIGRQYIEIAESTYMEILSAGGPVLLTMFGIFIVILYCKIYKKQSILAVYLSSAFLMISTNPIGYHPVIPLFISIIIYIASNRDINAERL